MPSDPSGPRMGFPKNLKKSRFFLSCQTLTTIQLRKKTQLTKVVSLLTRFVRPTQSRRDNRNFECFLAFYSPPLWPCRRLLQSWIGGEGYKGFKTTQKVRFLICCDALTTIQPRKKTQLTKVVSPLKRFVRVMPFFLYAVRTWFDVRSIALILENLLNTHNMYFRPVENFLEASEVQKVMKSSIFYYISGTYKLLLEWVSNYKNYHPFAFSPKKMFLGGKR